jgi:predicted SAM-dependent methyltransferase
MKVRAEKFREHLYGKIIGSVLEIGPGQVAFPTPRASSVVLVDKLPADLHKELFPELGADISIVEPDVLLDLDKDRLKPFSSNSFDVVIASHMLEHLAQPFRMLDEIYRVLVMGGTSIIFLPDRTRTFDKYRNCPNFEHFVNEYNHNSFEVTDDDLFDYMLKVENFEVVDRNDEFVALHLKRSIHVHAWTDIEFIELLEYMQSKSDFKFEIVDGVSSSKDERLEEFGVVLRKVESGKKSNLVEQWHSKVVLGGALMSNNLNFAVHRNPTRMKSLRLLIDRLRK